MANLEKSMETNGFRLRSWGDVAAIATVTSVLLALFLGVLLWGLKLESELNTERLINSRQSADIRELKTQVDQGILPRAEEQNLHQDEEIREIKDRLRRLEDSR